MSDKSSSQALKDFVSETEEIIGSLNLDLVRLADSVDSGDCDPDVLNGIFRGAHSIKGLAGMFGFDDLSTLSHSMLELSQSLLERQVTGLEASHELLERLHPLLKTDADIGS